VTTKTETPIIVWFRKDLRTDDHAALSAAAESGRPIVALYIREPETAGTGPLGSAQGWWLHHSLVAFGRQLAKLGTPLVLRSGPAETVLGELVTETGAGAVCWNRRHDPAGMQVDTDVAALLSARGIEIHSYPGELLHDPDCLLTVEKKPYRVYTPFWKALEKGGDLHEPLDAPAELRAPQAPPATENIEDWSLLPVKPDWAAGFAEVWTPGEQGAQERLEAFLDGAIDGYKAARDRPAKDGTSLLSPHLAFGEISPARVWHATRGVDAPADDIIHFRKELAWREFCAHLLYYFPALAQKNWNPRFDGFPWQGDDAAFEHWTRGTTGYPVVDAGMRQLWKHGWMHNRVRMITASFLIKHLMIDWRRGEAWFRDTLVDADPASNAANWQWVAGSGADASPFFRIFNPILQGEKFDPDGDYVRAFVPELAELDSAWIHKPFEAPDAALKKAGVVLGKTYPKPIVVHREARERALAAFRTLKSG
jgi:deoxyribodipyrimidine photo-lyase